jgi:hypothetical protein
VVSKERDPSLEAISLAFSDATQAGAPNSLGTCHWSFPGITPDKQIWKPGTLAAYNPMKYLLIF